MGIASGTDCSSGEEDGDAEWKAAIDSVAALDFSSSNGLAEFHSISGNNGGTLGNGYSNHDDEKKTNAPCIKLYQIKAQKLLDGMLEKNIEIVRTNIPAESNYQSDGGVIRLFRKAPPGMRQDSIDHDTAPQKKLKIIPGDEIKENSKIFRRRIASVVVDGSDILAAAREASQRSLVRWEAREAAAMAAAKREEERVAELRGFRGEKWLPSVARDMKGDA